MKRARMLFGGAALAGFGVRRLLRKKRSTSTTPAPQMSGGLATSQTTGLTPGPPPAEEFSATELPTARA